MTVPNVFVVLLNWNAWSDTLECLESLLRCNFQKYQVLLCDNASQDGSLAYIEQWCKGELDVIPTRDKNLSSFIFPPIPKPVQYIIANQHEAEAGEIASSNDAKIILIRNMINGGYAAGNNVALRYILHQKNFSYVWLLNNDTIVPPDSLAALVRSMESNPFVGICGSKIYYCNKPYEIQALGGATYNKWLGTVRNIRPNFNGIMKSEMAYVIGASMMVSKSFLTDVGLMDEEYFIYYEELDWALRAKGRYRLGYAPDSVIYHKEGSSIGTSVDHSKRSIVSEYYLVRNRFILAKKYFPYTLPTIYIGLVLMILKRIIRRQFDRILIIFKAAFENKWKADRL